MKSRTWDANRAILELDNPDPEFRAAAAWKLRDLAESGRAYLFRAGLGLESLSGMRDFVVQSLNRLEGKRARKFEGDDKALSKLEMLVQSESDEKVLHACREAIRLIKL